MHGEKQQQRGSMDLCSQIVFKAGFGLRIGVRQPALFTCYTWPALPLPRPDFSHPTAKICESQSKPHRSASMLFKTGHRHGRGTEKLQWSQRGSTLKPVKTTPLRLNLSSDSFCFSVLSVHQPQMSLPVVLPGSCCPVTGASQLAEPSYRNRPRGFSASSRIASGGSRLLLPGRPLLSLGLLQLLLGGSMVALSFGALSLSNSPPIRNSCPFWAGSSVS